MNNKLILILLTLAFCYEAKALMLEEPILPLAYGAYASQYLNTPLTNPNFYNDYEFDNEQGY